MPAIADLPALHDIPALAVFPNVAAISSEVGAGVSMHFGCDPSVAGFPSTAGVSVFTFLLCSYVAGSLFQLLLLLIAPRAISGISDVNGFSTFVLFSSVTGFPFCC